LTKHGLLRCYWLFSWTGPSVRQNLGGTSSCGHLCCDKPLMLRNIPSQVDPNNRVFALVRNVEGSIDLKQLAESNKNVRVVSGDLDKPKTLKVRNPGAYCVAVSEFCGSLPRKRSRKSQGALWMSSSTMPPGYRDRGTVVHSASLISKRIVIFLVSDSRAYRIPPLQHRSGRRARRRV
jgi:hypothetical protein